ncbi:nicotinate-nucleotide adenylyltransferase [Paenibacillus sambharensis]|uniref:Probable nicotinate-nucleotide adenylyltransferase n=1 Tax=Paenibacillus sambharensis TaxID=1803190 RepID=A0A2W1L503_9BACL|nr:nicotinate-nucleotide adenylyltransferase [Paenibacillus sambharensis]PZD93979.1 nicotinate-nucleotide adenylyltransferase [Paenibacillus sambharensis]
MLRAGIMGGTFDPIHNGHLLAAETALDVFGLDEIWFVPAATPPLKSGAPDASDRMRLDMVRLAAEGHPNFRVLDIELERGGVSYSVDTVAALQERCPDTLLSYIIGGDRIGDLAQWHRVAELAERLEYFIGFSRPGYPADLSALPSPLRDKVKTADMPQMEISSTAVRLRRAEGRSIRFLVPDSVYEYIMRNDIYGS